jgi:hypothetical protein
MIYAMITGESITYQTDKEASKPCEEFSFKGGIHYLSYCQEDIFSVLSLSSVPFLEGTLTIDDVQLTPTGFVGGTAKVIKLDVKDTGTLTLACFYGGSEDEADSSFQKLSSELQALKFSAKTDESKKDKLKMLKTVLSLNNISYLLIDLNDPLNGKNRAVWEEMLSDYEGCSFFLLPDFAKQTVKSSEEKITVKGLNLPYRIPLGLTSFLAIFLSAYAQSEKIKLSSKWGLALIGAIVFLIANIVIGVSLTKKTVSKDTKREKLTSFEFISTTANVIGIALALLVAWLLSSKLTLLSDGVFKGLGLAIMVLLGGALVLAQFVIGHVLLTSSISKSKSLSRSSNPR